MQMSIEDYEKIRPLATFKYQERLAYYHVPNRMTLWRVESLLSKEPITIAWLNQIKPDEILLDVGANVGMYTIFAACFRDAQVYAFEPESQNFALLNANINTNKKSDRVRAYCLALSDKIGLDRLYLSDFSQGGSCHSLGEEVGFDLKPRPSPFAQGIYSLTIDAMVEGGAIPVPHYIKIDVDGFEHKVLAGAAKTLLDSRLKSIIVELNPHLIEHRKVVDNLVALGFQYDQVQVSEAARQAGAFKDVGEWVFFRVDPAASIVHTYVPDVVHNNASLTKQMVQHVLQRLEQTPIEASPFPYAVIDNVFPTEYYEQIQRFFPAKEDMVPLSETGRTGSAYKERLVTLFDENGFSHLSRSQRQFWAEFGGWLYSPEFINGMIAHFQPYVAERIAHVQDKHGRCEVRGDALIVSDQTKYAIGPHTDAAHRLITFLFYLPQDERHSVHGTSLYQPLDPDFECPGGPHHSFDQFKKLQTLAFIPNRLLVFVRTNRSFHGVEAVLAENVERHLLINNIRLTEA